MSDERFNISRRKALASLGTIGVASAGAGLGTSAYFSDQETFQNNQLTAGTLDLGVGYSAHYSDWSDDEGDGVSDVVMYDGAAGETGSASEVPDNYTGLPTNDAWLIAVPDGDVSTFLGNTQQGEVVNEGCDSDGISALTQADGESAIINLGDVKPGDFGEVTFDLELCTNPGYVWMNNPGGFTADENGTTEPERDDPDEADEAQEDYDEVVELLDVVQAAVWLDDGDNYQDGGESPILVDSLRNVLNELNSSNGVRIDGQNISPGDSTPTDLTATGVNRFDVNDDSTYGADIELDADPVDSGKVAHATSDGPTADYVTSAVSIPSGITISDVNTSGGLTYEYYEGSGNERAAPDEVSLLLEDDAGARRVVSRTWNDGDGASVSWAVREVGQEITDDFAGNSGRDWVEVTSGGANLGPDLTNDTDISGSSEVLAMAVGRGNSDPNTSRNLDVYYRNPKVQNGEYELTFPTSCFRGETEFSAVFAWWVPIDHGNEMQSDKVEFDLGFYTEQCRHNDGSGMNNSNVSDNQIDDT